MAGSIVNLALLCNFLCVVFVATQRSGEVNLEDIVSSIMRNTTASTDTTSSLTTVAPLAKGVSIIDNLDNETFLAYLQLYLSSLSSDLSQ